MSQVESLYTGVLYQNLTNSIENMEKRVMEASQFVHEFHHDSNYDLRETQLSEHNHHSEVLEMTGTLSDIVGNIHQAMGNVDLHGITATSLERVIQVHQNLEERHASR